MGNRNIVENFLVRTAAKFWWIAAKFTNNKVSLIQ